MGKRNRQSEQKDKKDTNISNISSMSSIEEPYDIETLDTRNTYNLYQYKNEIAITYFLACALVLGYLKFISYPPGENILALKIISIILCIVFLRLMYSIEHVYAIHTSIKYNEPIPNEEDRQLAIATTLPMILVIFLIW